MLSKQDIYLHLFLLCFLRKYVAVTVTVDDVDVAEGSEARITCNIVPASSGAVPVVTWYNVTNAANDLIANYQGGFGLVEPGYSERFSVENDITLVITNTHRSDSGTYQCSANLVGDSPSVDDDICTLTVNYFSSGNVITINVNSNTTAYNVIITCFPGTVDGNPVPDINLYKDTTIINTQKTLPLTYTIATVSDDDSGDYRCEASNSVGSVTSNTITLDYYKPRYETTEPDTLKPGKIGMIAVENVEVNPERVTYIWSIDGVVDPNANSASFTFTGSMVVGTVHTISVNVTNLIGSTSKTIRIAVSERSNSNTGLIIGMLFVGIFIGAVGLYIGQIIHNKIRKKSLSEKQNTDKRKQDTYMDYVGESRGQNQTYQDLQHRVEESAYVNVKAGNKNKKGKM
ncbi:uncharacterized protein [Antedon mediterranea]|uniref:uncharacterized protein n=1 Tax=Antedon mediterranea TaxID=105859 RepID=UPI003AF9687D